jgi:hypothetical protein
MHRAIAHQRTFLEEPLDSLFHEEWITLGALEDDALESVKTLTRSRIGTALALSRHRAGERQT